MKHTLDTIPSFVNTIKGIKETILANIVLIGQIPSPTFHEEKRVDALLERLIEAQVDECTTDNFQNPVGIIRGTDETKDPIFVVAHIDTFIDKDIDHNYTVKENSITGPGVIDNSTGVGILASLPTILQKLDLKFESDIVLAGVIQSLGSGNLGGIRHLLETWETPVRGAICVEGGELGRLNYYSDGTRRCEIDCHMPANMKWEHNFKPNAILVLNEVINQILTLKLPQRPRARVIIGKISGGFKHGIIAYDGTLGFEIQSDSDEMVKSIYNDIDDIVEGISHECQVKLELKTISSINASRIKYNHPLVKSASSVMKKLDIEPVSEASGSELSMFLSRQIPAVTLGITHGENYTLTDAKIEIEPIFKGITQIIGVLMAIDSGVCDE